MVWSKHFGLAGKIEVRLIFFTFDENSREVSCDVLRDPQSVPGINGPIWKNYSGGADVIAAVVLIGLGRGLCHLLSTDVVVVCALLHLIPK